MNIFRRILKHLAARRKWNRTKRWMRQNAEGRMVVGLYSSGVLRRGI